jgi:hypothetical protein
MVLDRNNKADGIKQDHQNMLVLRGSTGQMGLEVIIWANGIRHSQGHGQDDAGRTNKLKK